MTDPESSGEGRRSLGRLSHQRARMRGGEDALPNAAVGNVDLYYVCYCLSRLGWNV